ncbi:TPA: hypothetical protein JD396_24705 [Citrobacter freundii]|nr:hypothetical protein C6985_10105 [Escherichia coli]HAU5817922.1 hypothetical protein [Citrobacter freundii]
MDGYWCYEIYAMRPKWDIQSFAPVCKALCSSSLSRSHPFLQDILNQCETEWCNHHFFSVTITLPGEGLRMSVFHLCTRLCTNLAIVG